MTATDSDPQGHHDWQSATYVADWIANYASRDVERQPVLRRMAQLLPLPRTERVRILDLGGGYGMLTREVLEEFPYSTVVLEDLSAPMLERAKANLAEYGDRVTFVQADLRDSSWIAAVPWPFHCAVSSIAIHNVREPDTIRTIYTEVLQVLSPGGCFFNLDIVASSSYPDGGGGDVTVGDHLRWLTEAGFEKADVLFEEGNQALLTGRRADARPLPPERARGSDR